MNSGSTDNLLRREDKQAAGISRCGFVGFEKGFLNMSKEYKSAATLHFALLLKAASEGDAKRMASHQASLLRLGIATRLASDES